MNLKSWQELKLESPGVVTTNTNTQEYLDKKGYQQRSKESWNVIQIFTPDKSATQSLIQAKCLTYQVCHLSCHEESVSQNRGLIAKDIIWHWKMHHSNVFTQFPLKVLVLRFFKWSNSSIDQCKVCIDWFNGDGFIWRVAAIGPKVVLFISSVWQDHWWQMPQQLRTRKPEDKYHCCLCDKKGDTVFLSLKTFDKVRLLMRTWKCIICTVVELCVKHAHFTFAQGISCGK